jgi:hypothetical protein
MFLRLKAGEKAGELAPKSNSNHYFFDNCSKNIVDFDDYSLGVQNCLFDYALVYLYFPNCYDDLWA